MVGFNGLTLVQFVYHINIFLKYFRLFIKLKIIQKYSKEIIKKSNTIKKHL